MRQPVDQDLTADPQVDDGIDPPAELVQLAVEGLGLGDGPRKAVQDEAVFCVRLLQSLLDDVDHQVVRHQLAAVHVALHLLAKRRPGPPLGTQHVTGRDRGDVVGIDQGTRLRSLSRARRAKKYQVHEPEKRLEVATL